mmetsp:Transcript_42254/g.62603  ORF Transcript_42254/g.62603 Transcript_42254/m.62603 type:complete len:467 (-) Transcript_42254:245-1645(-)
MPPFPLFGNQPSAAYYEAEEETTTASSWMMLQFDFLELCVLLAVLWATFVLLQLDLIRRNASSSSSPVVVVVVSDQNNNNKLGGPSSKKKKPSTDTLVVSSDDDTGMMTTTTRPVLEHKRPLTPWQRYDTFSPYPYQPPSLGMNTVPVSIGSFVKPTGRRRALIIGINYPGTSAELNGCHNDAYNIKNLLLRQGFPNDSSHLVLLTDTSKQQPNYRPTYDNIFKAMQWLTQGVAAGDVLFFHFSGHGGQKPDMSGCEADGLNETIVPLDYQERDQITDDELWGSLVHPLPAGARLTALMDCCHSGTGLDLPHEYSSKKTGLFGTKKSKASSRCWKEDLNPAHSQGDVVLFSGCRDHQTSADVMTKHQGAGGAMTQAFLAAFKAKSDNATYPEFLRVIQQALQERQFPQRPQLTSSQPFDVQNRVFSLVDTIEPNHNEQVGRMKQRHVRPKIPGQAGLMDTILFGGN